MKPEDMIYQAVFKELVNGGVSAARAGDYASQSVKEYKRKGFEGKGFNAFIKEQARLGKLRAIKGGKPRK